jgi:hypothetical protein
MLEGMEPDDLDSPLFYSTESTYAILAFRFFISPNNGPFRYQRKFLNKTLKNSEIESTWVFSDFLSTEDKVSDIFDLGKLTIDKNILPFFRSEPETVLFASTQNNFNFLYQSAPRTVLIKNMKYIKLHTVEAYSLMETLSKIGGYLALFKLAGFLSIYNKGKFEKKFTGGNFSQMGQ